MAAILQPLPAAVLLNAEFSLSDRGHPLYGWSAPFSVAITNGRAVVSEDGVHLPVRLQQRFDLSNVVTQLEITLDQVQLAANLPGQPPDAFQISLLHTNLQPLVAPTGQPESAAFFSFQQDGRVFFGPQVTVPGAATSGVTWTPQFPLTLRVQLTNLPAVVPGLLFFDLVGFDRPASSVVVRRVRLRGWEPVGGADAAELLQNASVSLLLLTNDFSRTGHPLPPASWRLEAPPAHGVVTFQPQSGAALYQPAAGYVGTDVFTYSIADEAGHRSDPVPVTLTILPVSQNPLDAWRRQFFSPTDLADPAKEATLWGDNADPDGDGRNNLQEFVAATNPTNAASRLEFNIERFAGGVRLRITPRADGRLYTVWTARSPAGPYLPLVQPQWQTNGQQLLLTDASPAAGAAFYRLQVTLWPSAEMLAWRQQYFSSADLADPAKEATLWGDHADPDGDGRNNLEEYVAGTAPTNSTSRLEFNVERGPQGACLRITPRAEGRLYVVLVSDNPQGPYTPLTNAVVITQGEALVVTDPTAGSRLRFYRLQVALAPPGGRSAWRQQYFSSADLADPAKEATLWGDTADPDRDGRNNLQEYVAGTNPTNAASRLEFQIERTPNATRLVIAPRVEGRTYTVLVSEQLLGPYIPLANAQVQSVGNTLVITDVSPPGRGTRFYRLQVSLP